MSVQEIKRLFQYLFLWIPPLEFILNWIQWRQYHQTIAKNCHYKRNTLHVR